MADSETMTEKPQIKEPYLEVTFRHDRPLAAYLYLPRRSDQQVQATRQAGEGLVVDLDRDGVPIGIEITAPGRSPSPLSTSYYATTTSPRLPRPMWVLSSQPELSGEGAPAPPPRHGLERPRISLLPHPPRPARRPAASGFWGPPA
jgi:uncharacterized protein YuzE